MERRAMTDAECKSIYTLNTWTDEQKEEARRILASGKWLHFGASCIGHTMAQMVERQGIAWAQQEYGEALEVAIREGWGYKYCRINEDEQRKQKI